MSVPNYSSVGIQAGRKSRNSGTLLPKQDARQSYSNLAIAKFLQQDRFSSPEFDPQSRTDKDTGLFDRTFLEEILAVEAFRASRYDWPVGLVVVRVQNLAEIARADGLERQTELLQQCAREIRQSVRGSDTVTRYDEDKFAVVLPRTNRSLSGIVLERLQTNLSKLGKVEIVSREHSPADSDSASVEPASQHSAMPRIVLGAAFLPDDGPDAETLERTAIQTVLSPTPATASLEA